MTWEPYGDHFGGDSLRERNAKLRSQRLLAARQKGTHTKMAWKILAEVFGKCVACGVPYADLYGGGPTKDHIEPIYAGGCDCLGNLQPLCRHCNSSGIGADMRNIALPGWFGRFRLLLSERCNGR